MTYAYSRQYRCTIVRGKAFKDLDNLLLAYASIVNEICPCEAKDFETLFNNRITTHFGVKLKKKTLDNHRTEIVGKLFGMYYKGKDNIIYCSSRVNKLIEDSDQPAFFKELLLKYQFPTGMSKITTVNAQLLLNIGIRQFPFIIKLLKLANSLKIIITKSEIAYYVLNSLDVLKGIATPEEVLTEIKNDRLSGVKRKIIVPGKASSYSYQHINEQLNLLVLANLIFYDNDSIIINTREGDFIDLIAGLNYNDILFDFTKYNFKNLKDRNLAETEWNIYFSEITDINPKYFNTSAIALLRAPGISIPTSAKSKSGNTTVEIGDEGEEYVYNYELSRISKINPRLTNRIKLFGKIRGLGYDIHSIYGEGKKADFVKYIEVKSTKRITTPDANYIDCVNLTKNEWSAAQQHGENFHIYRLYLTNDGVKMFVISNPFEKSETGEISIEAIAYRLEFNNKSGFYINE